MISSYLYLKTIIQWIFVSNSYLKYEAYLESKYRFAVKKVE